MKKTAKSALFWYGIVLKNGEIYYHFSFEDQEEDMVGSLRANIFMDNAKYMNYPIVCLN